MQGIRAMHCTIWTEGVREIVSAEDSDVKFIVSDHPVTIYNHAAPPDARMSTYPNDPSIALKGSQTIFPLNCNFCLILTNLEYAKDPSTNPLDKRTFARNYRNSMVRTDAFIRTRKLSSQDVSRVNYVLKARARRYIAAGREDWLYPEKTISEPWADIGKALLPPKDELWHFGGELFARFESGDVHYQDEFGRTEKERDFLKKELPSRPLRAGDICGCGSGRTFKACCETKALRLRPTWSELSIRERNLMLFNGIVNVLGLDSGKDWIAVRRELTDEQIGRIYFLYEALWPRETDLLSLLPKPDGTARAVYTGSIHPSTIAEFALGSSLYFGELFIEHPFLHAGTVKKEFSPVENPKIYRQEFLKTVLLFLNVMPLVEIGLVHLIPDPCNFDMHLRDQMFYMARSRSDEAKRSLRKDARLEELMREDFKRNLMSLSRDALRAQIAKTSPELDETKLEDLLEGIVQMRERDPLAVLQEGSLDGGEKGGQFTLMKLSPNFEMAMYLAQVTGSCVVTDNQFRWQEIQKAVNRGRSQSKVVLSTLSDHFGKSIFAFPQNPVDIETLTSRPPFAEYRKLMEEIFKYLSKVGERGPKSNREAQLNGRFVKVHTKTQDTIRKAQIPLKEANIHCAFPLEGIQDNSVSRLLLMSSSEAHLPIVPMAFYIEEKKKAQ